MRVRCPAHIGQAVLLPVPFCVIFFTAVACDPEAPLPAEEAEMTLPLSSTAFVEGGQIPVKYTCDGEEVSLPLVWGEPPQHTQTLVLIVDDPDAPSRIFTH